MAEGLPPSGHRYGTRMNVRNRSLEDVEPEDSAHIEDLHLTEANGEGSSSSQTQSLECAICLQTCVHPTRLPCGHIFCFLCMKGVFRSTAKCAMCRCPIPRSFPETPDLLEIPASSSATSEEEDAYHWFYEGRHGWWEYDPRANADLEDAFRAGESKIELLIAGYVYLVDFHGMMQYRKTDPGRRRAVKRDKAGTACKGIAGIRPAVLRVLNRNTTRTLSQRSRGRSFSVADFTESLNNLSLENDDDVPYELELLAYINEINDDDNYD